MAQHTVLLNLISVQCWGIHHFLSKIIPMTNPSHYEKCYSFLQSESPQEIFVPITLWLLHVTPGFTCSSNWKNGKKRGSFNSNTFHLHSQNFTVFLDHIQVSACCAIYAPMRTVTMDSNLCSGQVEAPSRQD